MTLPRWVRALLTRLARPGEAEDILGDLEEAHRVRLRGHWRVVANILIGLEALDMARVLLRDRRAAARSMKRERRRGRLDARDLWSWEGFVDKLTFNVRYAVRRLRQSPVFTLVAIVSLALGIGANTAMFTLVNAFLIRDLPFEGPETLVNVYESSSGCSFCALSYPNYEDLAEGSTDVFAGISGMQWTLLQADVGDGVEALWGEAVTGNYFSLTGIQPVLGRLISDEDHVAPGAHPVAVLGYGYWERRYGMDPAVVGSQIRLSRRQYTIIGVAPQAYTGSMQGIVVSAYVPMMMFDELMGGDNTLEARNNDGVFARARLLPGVTMAQAETVVTRISADLRENYPLVWTPTKTFALVPTADVIMDPSLDTGLVLAAGMLMIVVGLVLLIACANLTSFLLARAAGSARHRGLMCSSVIARTSPRRSRSSRAPVATPTCSRSRC